MNTVPVYADDSMNFGSMLDKCKVNYAAVSDYTCNLHKRESIGGTLREERNIILKFKKPEHFYMKWLEGRNEVIESIYVQGKYDNKVVVHLRALFGIITISVDPRGKWALKNNRHPIMEAELGHIIKVMEKNYRRAEEEGDLNITVQGDTVLNNRKMMVVKAVFPQNKEYYGHRIYIFIDQDLFLPVKFTVYNWENEFLEEYHFDNLKLNAGLTEKDFDIKNPEYGFSQWSGNK